MISANFVLNSMASADFWSISTSNRLNATERFPSKQINIFVQNFLSPMLFRRK